MKIFLSEQMRLAERLAADTAGISTLRLMENAGAAAAEIIRSEWDVRSLRCVCVCGNGGNGGDGLAVALRLSEAGADAMVVLACGKPRNPDALELFQKIHEAGIRCVDWSADTASAVSVIACADILVDALFGIGFHGSPEGAASDAIDCMNHSCGVVYSLDIPSGAEADTGAVPGPCVKAHATISFSLPKFAHLQLPASALCGRVYTADISIPEKIISGIPSDFEVTDREFVKTLLPPRSPDSHKGDFGTVLAICGSYAMPGAAILSSSAAVKCGAGLTRLAVPETAYPFVAAKTNELTYLPLPCNGAAADGKVSADMLLPYIRKASCVLIGCGLTDDDVLLPVLSSVLKNAVCPVIVDADGINLLSRNIDLLQSAPSEVVLTPHMGEMSRLTGKSVSDIRRDRIACAVDFAERHNVTVVLKGSRTVTALPDGHVFCNLNGNPGMATGGSGDVLAGMIAGLTAQGVPAPKAAAAAVYIHGAAGDLCAEQLTQYCMTPTDILNTLWRVFREIT